MNFVLQTPSLQRLAAVKIVAHLWSQPNIITLFATSFHGLSIDDVIEYDTPWQEVEDKVRNKASALLLPEPCKEELWDVIKPIGMEIVTWCKYHSLDSYPFNFLDKLLPLQFCWTMHGTVDYMKTAQLIVKDEGCDVVRRFEVACLNCLEDEARHLFPFIPNDRMHKYISEVVGYESMHRRVLVAYFTCALSGDEDSLHRLLQTIDSGSSSINHYLFAVVLNEGNRATCEYFLQKVSQKEKEQALECWEMLDYCCEETPTCRLIFYLSHMIEELFVPCIVNVLISLLRWPLQSLFLEAAKRVWSFMAGSDCAEVLDSVIVKIVEGYKDYDYAQLFKKLWPLTLAEHKQHFLNEIDYLENLIATKQTEFIQLCLNRAPSHQLRPLIENNISDTLRDEKVISDVALLKCKEKAALDSSKDQDNLEKRLRSECVSQLVDLAMERRMKRRETAGVTTS